MQIGLFVFKIVRIGRMIPLRSLFGFSVTLELLKGDLRLKRLKIGEREIRLKEDSWMPGDRRTFGL